MTKREIVSPEDLQAAIRCVVEDYAAFVSRRPLPGLQDDPKAFAAHHAAAKSALAHLEHLLKLTRGSVEAGELSGPPLAGDLLRQARGHMAEARDEEEHADDGDPG